MDDYNFDFESRQIDSSARTDSDGGGGTNFVFHDGSSGREKGQDGDNSDREKKPIDFGAPVELELSAAALQAEAVAMESETESAADELPSRNPLVGQHINIDV